MRVEAWKGLPKGWAAFDTKCGHNHGVNTSKVALYREVIFCHLRPWKRWTHQTTHINKIPTLFAPVSFRHKKEVYVNDGSKERSFSLTAFYRNIQFSYSSPLRKR